MTLDQVIKLIEAGYSRDEIEAMAVPEAAEEPKEAAPAEEPKPAENEDLKAISKELLEIKKGLYAMSIMNTKQPEKKTADEILSAALGGKKGD